MVDDGFFSGIVRISNIDDYIAPSQNCIIPLAETININKPPPTSIVGLHKSIDATSIGIEKKSKSATPIKVSLNDCLACNGCVTTAEAILIEQQSADQFLAGLRLRPTLSVVTVSPQSIASIAVRRRMSLSAAARAITAFLHKSGVDYVLDSSFARNFSLIATFDEYLRRKQLGAIKPLFSSACPGWICYAEKTYGQLLIPHLSRVRSPQAIAGALVKNYLAQSKGLNARQVYHASIMPCFDKKLEASRSDFMVPDNDVREVDCVMSTIEFNALLDVVDDDERNDNEVTTEMMQLLRSFDVRGPIGHGGGTSGGYAEYVIRETIRQLAVDCIIEQKITRKNKDFEEIEIVSNGAVILRVAKAYGFRNIQNIVQKVKNRKCPYDYVEIMACPGGCTSGGGQIRGETSDERSKIESDVRKEYDSALVVDPIDDCKNVLTDWIGSIDSDMAKRMIYTDYHAVDRNIAQQQFRW